jgi:hypothetical protein
MVQSRGRWRPAQTPEPVGILRNKDGKTLIATRHRSWERIPIRYHKLGHPPPTGGGLRQPAPILYRYASSLS